MKIQRHKTGNKLAFHSRWHANKKEIYWYRPKVAQDKKESRFRSKKWTAGWGKEKMWMPCFLTLCGTWGILMLKIPCTASTLYRISMAGYWTDPGIQKNWYRRWIMAERNDKSRTKKLDSVFLGYGQTLSGPWTPEDQKKESEHRCLLPCLA